MAYDDYAPVLAPDDEEEQRRRYPYAPVGAPAPAEGTPLNAAVSAYAPVAPMIGSTEDLESKAGPMAGGYAPVSAPKAPGQARLESLIQQGAPPVQQPHGFKGLMSELFLPQSMRNRPQREYDQNLAVAERQAKDEQGAVSAQSTEELRGAQTDEATARADALRHPQPKPKEEEWSIVPGMTGPNGEIVQQEKTSGVIRFGQPGVKPLKEPAEQEREKDITDELATLKLPDTPENRTKARAEIAKRNPQAHIEVNPPTDKTSARSDRSYQYNDGKLDKLGKPVEDAVGRLGRLQETLRQGSPQADALVAPELLTVMAGGAGSGLRMNEAEISRIVGGRSKWESLQAAANQWKLDPTKANSITPEQRQQIHKLVDAVHQKLIAKQRIVDDAREKLLESDDPKEHRKIVNDTHRALTAIDEGQAGGGGSGKAVSLADARKLPANKGKSDDDIRKDIKAHGHEVTE